MCDRSTLEAALEAAFVAANLHFSDLKKICLGKARGAVQISQDWYEAGDIFIYRQNTARGHQALV